MDSDPLDDPQIAHIVRHDYGPALRERFPTRRAYARYVAECLARLEAVKAEKGDLAPPTALRSVCPSRRRYSVTTG